MSSVDEYAHKSGVYVFNFRKLKTEKEIERGASLIKLWQAFIPALPRSNVRTYRTFVRLKKYRICSVQISRCRFSFDEMPKTFSFFCTEKVTVKKLVFFPQNPDLLAKLVFFPRNPDLLAKPDFEKLMPPPFKSLILLFFVFLFFRFFSFRIFFFKKSPDCQDMVSPTRSDFRSWLESSMFGSFSLIYIYFKSFFSDGRVTTFLWRACYHFLLWSRLSKPEGGPPSRRFDSILCQIFYETDSSLSLECMANILIWSQEPILRSQVINNTKGSLHR
jgi:hypothetical protein